MQRRCPRLPSRSSGERAPAGHDAGPAAACRAAWGSALQLRGWPSCALCAGRTSQPVPWLRCAPCFQPNRKGEIAAVGQLESTCPAGVNGHKPSRGPRLYAVSQLSAIGGQGVGLLDIGATGRDLPRRQREIALMSEAASNVSPRRDLSKQGSRNAAPSELPTPLVFCSPRRVWKRLSGS